MELYKQVDLSMNSVVELIERLLLSPLRKQKVKAYLNVIS
jgi:hypothetical protein